MTIGGHLHSYATKIFPHSALFRSSSSSSSMSQPQARAPPLITPSEVATWVVFGAVYHAPVKWVGLHCRDMYETHLTEKVMQNRLEELDRFRVVETMVILENGSGKEFQILGCQQKLLPCLNLKSPTSHEIL